MHTPDNLYHLHHNQARERTASESYVNVFTSHGEPVAIDAQTGNYWPYRYHTFHDAVTDETATQQTVDRCHEFLLDFGRVNTHTAIPDFCDAADRLDATYAMARLPPGFGATRDYYDMLQQMYDEFDAASRTANYVFPIVNPHVATAELVTEVNPYMRQPTYTIPDLRYRSVSEQVAVLEDVRETLGADTNLILADCYPTIELARAIRDQPQLIDMITLAPIAEHDAAAALPSELPWSDALTDRGTSVHRTELDPGVELANEFSFLTSPLVDETHFEDVAAASVVPHIPGDEPAVTPDARTEFPVQREPEPDTEIEVPDPPSDPDNPVIEPDSLNISVQSGLDEFTPRASESSDAD